MSRDLSMLTKAVAAFLGTLIESGYTPEQIIEVFAPYPLAPDDGDVLQAIRLTNPGGWAIQLSDASGRSKKVRHLYGEQLSMRDAIARARGGKQGKTHAQTAQPHRR